jgi:small conductance mechanosensitive channel
MEHLTNLFMEWLAAYGLKVVGAIVILVVGRIIVGFLAKMVGRLLRGAGTDETLTKFIMSLTRIGLLIFVILAAVNTLGVETTSFIAVIGAAGLAIGFALQGSLANFASGVMLIIFRPFKTGDFVEIAGTVGTVDAIQIFNTVLKTPDNKMIIVPNSGVTGGNITNYSANETRRIDLVFGISYDDDIKKAKKILERILAEDERVLKEPAPVVAVSELADSSVNFVVRPWAKTSDYWRVYFDITEKVKLTFDEQGISIPYPQRDIHMHEAISEKAA